MANVIVFGASGATGRLVVESALRAGHTVTAFVRDPGRLTEAQSRARVVEGDAMEMLGAGFIVRLALKRVMEDKEVQEAFTMASDCDWTIVRPVMLTNAPAKGILKSGVDLRWNIASSATRADVANYTVGILADSRNFHKAITLKN